MIKRAHPTENYGDKYAQIRIPENIEHIAIQYKEHILRNPMKNLPINTTRIPNKQETNIQYNKKRVTYKPKTRSTCMTI